MEHSYHIIKHIKACRYVRPIIATLSMEPRRARKAPHPRLFAVGLFSILFENDELVVGQTPTEVGDLASIVAFRECDIMRCKNWRKKGRKSPKAKKFSASFMDGRAQGTCTPHLGGTVACQRKSRWGSVLGTVSLPGRDCTSHKNKRRICPTSVKVPRTSAAAEDRWVRLVWRLDAWEPRQCHCPFRMPGWIPII